MQLRNLPPSVSLLALGIYPALSLGATNATFDNTDPNFSWQGPWISRTPEAPCGNCSEQPDPQQIYNQTWSEGNALQTIATSGSFAFTGMSFMFNADGTSPLIRALNKTQALQSICSASTKRERSPRSFLRWPMVTMEALSSLQRINTRTPTPATNSSIMLFFFRKTDLPQAAYWLNWTLVWANPPGIESQLGLFDYAVVTTGEELEGVASGSETSSMTETSVMSSSHSVATSVSSSCFSNCSSAPLIMCVSVNDPIPRLSTEILRRSSSYTTAGIASSSSDVTGTVLSTTSVGATMPSFGNSRHPAGTHELGFILGGVFGGLVLLAALALACRYWRGRSSTIIIHPFLEFNAEPSRPANAVVGNARQAPAAVPGQFRHPATTFAIIQSSVGAAGRSRPPTYASRGAPKT
uniref:Uncharacterized protein n=1 Tax=Mycena chlorophos TaxID=658473 RepID=A0ABQ0LNF0_MYCCL|nr:predicted protein [Mycena chlorophos]